MTTFLSSGRKFVAVLVAAAAIGAVAAPDDAYAKGGRHGRGGHGSGSGPAAVGAAALLLGAIIASNAGRDDEAECRIEKRRVVDAHGKSSIRTVRVCE